MQMGVVGNVATHMTVEEQGLGYKLLLYLSSCLTGHAFPSGRGRIPDEVPYQVVLTPARTAGAVGRVPLPAERARRG